MSLRDAAFELRVNRLWLKGYCDGQGIKLTPYKASLCLSPADVARIKRFLAKRKREATKVHSPA